MPGSANENLYPQRKPKSTFVYIAFLYPPENVLPCKVMLARYQLVFTFMLC